MPCNGGGNGVIVGVPVGSGVKVVVGVDVGVLVAGVKAFEHEPRNKETVMERKTKTMAFISSFFLYVNTGLPFAG